MAWWEIYPFSLRHHRIDRQSKSGWEYFICGGNSKFLAIAGPGDGRDFLHAVLKLHDIGRIPQVHSKFK